jgi:hypothetical protein
MKLMTEEWSWERKMENRRWRKSVIQRADDEKILSYEISN